MIQTTHARTLLQRTPVLLGKAVLLAGFGFFLFIVGVASALFPQFSARLVPFLAIGVVFFVALLASRDAPIGEKFRLWWMTALLAIFALWPTYMIIKVGQLPALDGRRVIVGLSIVLTFYLLVSRSFVAKALLRPQPGPLKTGFWIITVFMLLRIASCFVSEAPLYSLVAVAWEMFYYFSMFFVAALFFHEEKFQDGFIKSILWLVFLVGFYVVIERLIGKNVLSDFAPRTEGLEDLAMAMQQGRIRDGQFRAQGTFEHPLVMAEFMAMSFCFGLAALLWPGRRLEKILGWISVFVAPFAIWFSGTRAGLLALGAGFGVVLMLKFFSSRKKSGKYEKSMRKIAFFMVAAGAVSVVTPTVLLIAQGRSAEEGSSTRVRMFMIELAKPAIQESPLLGTGAGTAGAVAGVKTGSGVTTLDSHLLALTVESGVPALIVFMLIFVYPAWVILEKMLSGTLTNQRFVAATAGALSVVFMFRAILWIPYNMAIVFMMVAIALAACQPKEEHAA